VWSADKDGIQGAVREIQPAMVDCYEGWLRTNPALGGKLLVSFTITADADGGLGPGRVTEAALKSSELEHPILEGCVLNAFQDLVFERPPGGPLKVNYPVRFSAEEPAEEP